MDGGSAVTLAASLRGVTASLVNVEVSTSGGIPGLDVVGMPDSAVLEARSRVRCALRACGFELPRLHVTINLAPGERRKTGTGYDLAIAVAILVATGQLPPSVAEGALFLGELALDGTVCPVRGDMAYAMLARESGLTLVTSAESPLAGAWAEGSRALADLGELRLGLGALPQLVSRAPSPATEPPTVLDFADVDHHRAIEQQTG